MKTAIVYTGGARSFEKCWKNHFWMIWRHFPNARFYCVTEDDEDAHKMSFLQPTNGPKDHAVIRKVKQPEMVIPPGCPSNWTPGQPYMHEPYHISVDPRAVLGQLWMLREGWRLYQETKTEEADLIIRIRPDLWFHSFEVPHGLRLPTPVNIHMGSFIPPRFDTSDVAWTPWWGRFGGINDRFALLGADAAEHYFTTYDKIPQMIEAGAPLHPETLVATSMRRGLISICDDMKAEFSTLRKTGEMRPPEITMIDLAHFKA